MNFEKESRVYLTSTSELKRTALRSVICSDIEIVSISQSHFELPEQPIDEYGIMCCKMRIDGALKEHPEICGLVYSIESFIKNSKERIVAICYDTRTGFMNARVHPISTGVDQKLFQAYVEQTHETWGGYTSTYGQYLKSVGECTNDKNWYGDRDEDLFGAIKCLHGKQSAIDTRSKWAYLDYFKDYPKPGVLYTSLDSIFSHHSLKEKLKEYLTRLLDGHEIDYVIGLETRGIHLGIMIANFLKCGFQMARKAGKLPYSNLLSTQYSTEYSKDAIEIAPTKALEQAKHILIVDDIIATGGSICAVAKCLQQKYSAQVFCLAPIQIPALKEIAGKRFEEMGIKNLSN